ncbi:MAG: leucine-rich repeat domain-containing protein [Firmicutes bacterium]|nr:leucine-rich repeat domain-containing protein [Bacillota bacterium]
MKKYFIYIILFFILVLFLVIKIFLSSNLSNFVFSTVNGFEVKDDEIIGCSLKGGNIVIPKMIDGVLITRIGDNAFKGLEIENVYIPDSITSIGSYAFADNNITTLNIPSSVKEIGEGAFIHNEIMDLNISKGTIIGDACFNDNKLDSSSAFFYRDNVLVSYGGSIKGNVVVPNIKSIGTKAFFESGIISVTIPNSVERIEDDAFKSNYLIEVYLSNNIDFVSETAFSNNIYLSEIVIDNNKDKLSNYPWGAYSSNLFWLK